MTWTVLGLHFIHRLKKPGCCLQLYPPVLISQTNNCYLPQSFANMSSGNAKIGQPAPDFTAKAVVDGQFKDLKLSDYRGKGALIRSCGKADLHLQITTDRPNFPLIYLAYFQESMSSSSSTHWTSRLCVPPRSWLSVTGWRTSAASTARLLAAP